MRLCVIAGMIDEKLHSKIAPLQHIPEVERIDLIRRQPYQGDKIHCHTPPKWLLKFMPLAELWRILALLGALLFKRPQAIIAFGTVPHGIYAWWFGKIFRIPVIQHVMGKNDLRLTFSHLRGKKLTLNAVKSAEAVAVRGAQMKKWLISQGIPDERLFTPQNIHDFDQFSPRNDEQTQPNFHLIYVGLLSPYKRVDLLLEAVSLAIKQIPSLTLLLVGDGLERTKLEQQARALGIEKHVTFTGKQAHKALPAYFHDARAFIMTSQGEGLPMAMIEAMSCGLPAIIPDDADFSEVATEDNAIIVDQHTPEAFANAICQLFTNDAYFQQLQAATRQLAKQKSVEYSIDYQSALWDKWLNQLIYR